MGMMNHIPWHTSIVQCLLQCIEHHICIHTCWYFPSNNCSWEHINNKGGIDPAWICLNIRKVTHLRYRLGSQSIIEPLYLWFQGYILLFSSEHYASLRRAKQCFSSQESWSPTNPVRFTSCDPPKEACFSIISIINYLCWARLHEKSSKQRVWHSLQRIRIKI